jgi:hypothetical protein
MRGTVTKCVTGHISLIQEERFRLIDATGRGFLFTLDAAATAAMPDLWHAYHTRLPVTVHYEGEPDLKTGVAHNVSLAAAPVVIGEKNDG